MKTLLTHIMALFGVVLLATSYTVSTAGPG